MNWWFIYYFSHSKVKASDSTNFYNQTFSSRAVVFEVYLGKARERLAKQDARARIVWAKQVYGRMCRAADWELQAMCCGAALSGSRGETPRLLFFCRHFLFQTKRKCRNAGSAYRLIMVGREGRCQSSTIRNCNNFVLASADSGQPQGLSLQVARQ